MDNSTHWQTNIEASQVKEGSIGNTSQPNILQSTTENLNHGGNHEPLNEDEEIKSQDSEKMFLEQQDDEKEKEILQRDLEPESSQSSFGIVQDSDGEQNNEDSDSSEIKDEEDDLEKTNVGYKLQDDEEDNVYDEDEHQKNEKDPTRQKETFQLKIRDYQRELIFNSHDTNSVIYLPTGTGKTRVAICSMYYYLCKYGTKKKIVFLANTIQLVKQQAEAIKQTLVALLSNEKLTKQLRQKLGENYINLNWNKDDINNQIKCIHGERSDEVGLTRKKKIDNQMNSKKQFLDDMQKGTVTVMIAQMFLNCLRRGYIKMTDYSFIVLDECHHCSGDHPFMGLMKEFYFDIKRKYKKLEDQNRPIEGEKLPVLMGLTASPVSQPFLDYKRLKKQMRQLCINLDSNFATYNQKHQIKSETQIILKNVEDTNKDYDPAQLLAYLEVHKQHGIAYNKLKYYFPQFFQCVEEVISFMAKHHYNLGIDNNQSNNIIDPELLLFYDIKECLLMKLRDIWLELGQYAFYLAFHDMAVELNGAKNNCRNNQNQQILNDVVEILNKYVKKFHNLYGQCSIKNMSQKLVELIKILEPPKQIFDKAQQQQKQVTVNDMVLVFAFKRRTVKYLSKVMDKYKETLSQQMKKFYKCVSITGYSKRTTKINLQYGHSYESNPSLEESQSSVTKYHRKFLDDIRDEQTNKLILKSKAVGGVENKNLMSEMARMYIAKMGKILLEVQEKYTNQLRNINDFKKKEYRILISTSVTEEGFDIPGCNLVISYDTPFNMKSYIQIKGRARKRFSKYYIFTSPRNHEKMIDQKQIYDETINNISEIALNQIAKQQFNSLDEIKIDESYKKVPTKGGALLNTNYALQLLKAFFTTLKHPNKGYYHYIESVNIGFKCIIRFPEHSPSSISFVVGQMYSNKDAALKSAAYKAVVLLKKEGFLKDDLRPAKQQDYEALIQLEKYDDLGLYERDEEYKKVFNEHVQILQVQEHQKKIVKFYFKSIKSKDLDFPAINKNFSIQKFEKGKVKCQLYYVKFSNEVNSSIFKQDSSRNQIGILTSFEEDDVSQIFNGLIENIESSKEHFYLKNITDSGLNINKSQYEKYKKVHDFLLAGEKNNQIDFYNELTGKNKILNNNWQYNIKKKNKLVKDPERQFYPVMVLIKVNVAGNKVHYSIDQENNDSIIRHIETFKNIYNYHNKPPKTHYEKKFEQNLTFHQHTLRNQIKILKNRQIYMVQSISREFCFHKGLIFNDYQYSEKVEEQEVKRHKNRLSKKYENLKKMFKHVQEQEIPIQEEKLLKVQLWRNKSKQDINRYITRQTKVKIKTDDHQLYRFAKEFILYPVSYPTMIRVALISRFVFQVVQDHTMALNFRKNYLGNIFGKIKEQIQFVKPYKYKFYPNVILQNGQGVFENLKINGRTKHLRIMGKSYLNTQKLINISAQLNLSNISEINLNNTNQEASNYSFIDNSKLQSSILKKSFIEYSKIGQEKEENQVQYQIDFEALTNLKLSDLLRTMTSKIYKHNKGDNYEQFQFIGDIVLKLLATIEIFLEKIKSEEGQMHINRANIICNSNLHRSAIRRKLFQYILTTKKKKQAPPLIKYKPENIQHEDQKYKQTGITKIKSVDEDEYQYIPAKVHADVVEALIGTFFLKNKSLEDCQCLLFAFGVLKKPTLNIEISNYDAPYKLPQLLVEFEERINYTFKNKGLLVQSLTHPTFYRYIEDVVDDINTSKILETVNKQNQSQTLSFLGKINESIQGRTRIIKHQAFYERLQFLGDAILDLIVIEDLYDRNKDEQFIENQGILSLLKQSTVSNKTLGYMALKFGMQDLILWDDEQVFNKIRQVKRVVKSYLPTPQEYEKINTGNLKLLGDVFESLIGAIFIDTRFNYKETQRIIMGMIGDMIKHFSSIDFVKDSPNYKYKEYLNQNNYRNIKIVKDPSGQIIEGTYIYKFQSGTTIVEQIRASNEKDAWDEFYDRKNRDFSKKKEDE